MSPRFFLVAIIASLAATTFCQAEPAPAKEDPLKKLLEEKFTPKPNEKPTTFDKRDYHPIGPKQNSPAQPNSGQPGRGGQLTPAHEFSVALGFSAIDTAPRSALFRLAADNRAGSGMLVLAASGEPRQPNSIARSQPTAGSFVVAQQGPPAAQGNRAGAIVNVYLIQLKPTATEQQISYMMRKYNLNLIPGGLPGLHILRVRGPDVVVGPNQNAFTQKILLDLRREPFVQSAAVDTTLSTRSVPRASNTTINSGDASYAWSWSTNKIAAPSPSPLSSAMPAKSLDGNWGLKSIRMPPVWTIVQRYRDANPTLARPKVAVFDTGFSKHEDLTFNSIRNPLDTDQPVAPTTSLSRPCESGHGNHVSGIIGANFGNGLGIDGIVPQAKIDAIVVLTPESLIEDPTLSNTTAESRIMLFGNVLPVIYSYLYDPSAIVGLRVVNLSLGYNIPFEGDPNSIPGLAENIANQAIMFAALARQFEKTVLFVAAAGNDSEGRTTPLDAKWSSPIVWAATELKMAEGPLKNVIIVEASNRFGERAYFSNLSKRASVSAPGIDILSTLLPGEISYSVCQGTSQATPHVAGVAAILFELDPTKKPAEIAEIIMASGTKQSKAPGAQVVQISSRLDAFEAVLRLPNNLTRLADLNRDGKVDIEDMKIFAKHTAMLADNRKNGTPFTEDLNGDGVVDANECNWPLIDLNGSGSASLALTDAKLVQGLYHTDLDVMALAWTDKTKDFKTALKETGLDVTLQAADAPATMAPAVSAQVCQ
jgi:subtilisin family serine protease